MFQSLWKLKIWYFSVACLTPKNSTNIDILHLTSSELFSVYYIAAHIIFSNMWIRIFSEWSIHITEKNCISITFENSSTLELFPILINSWINLNFIHVGLQKILNFDWNCPNIIGRNWSTTTYLKKFEFLTNI